MLNYPSQAFLWNYNSAVYCHDPTIESWAQSIDTGETLLGAVNDRTRWS